MRKILHCTLSILMACQFAACTTQAAGPGMVNGQLRTCPDTPNCVCSEDGESKRRITPLAFHGAPAKAWDDLKAIIPAMGGRIEQEENGYLRAVFTTRIFRFVDDLELRLVAADNLIHMRSASRIGYSDFGVNRRRVEKLRDRFSRELAAPTNAAGER